VAALEQLKLEVPAKRASQASINSRKVVVGKLALQRQGCRRDHDRLTCVDRTRGGWHGIGQ
jgi:hypothetical protein